jgi:hypothetical protein
VPADRIVHRSPQGIMTVLACALAAVGLPIFGAYREANPAPASAAEPVRYVTRCDGTRVALPPRRPIDPQFFTWAGVAVGAVAVVTELRVRGQIDLVRRGRVAEAIVDEVHVANRRHDYNWMKYGFIAEDGSAHHGRCSIDQTDAMALGVGSRAVVFYDPANPGRNIPEVSLWAVTWEEGGEEPA